MHSHKNLHNLTMVLTFVLLQSHSQLQFCPPKSCPTLPLTILQIMYPTIVIVQTIYLPLQLSCPRLNHGEIPVGHAASSPTDNLVWHAPNVYGHSTCCNDHKEGHCSQNACCLIERFLIEIGAFSTGSMFPEWFSRGPCGCISQFDRRHWHLWKNRLYLHPSIRYSHNHLLTLTSHHATLYAPPQPFPLI